jgi:hypothetical protein
MIARGVNRFVVGFGNIVIKLPSLRYGSRYFVQGMLSNLLEHNHWHICKHPQLAPVYHCGPLGLWLIMRRYRHVLSRRLTEQERRTLPFIGIDDNGTNVAVDNGRLVLVDYGNVDWFYDVSGAAQCVSKKSFS